MQKQERGLRWKDQKMPPVRYVPATPIFAKTRNSPVLPLKKPDVRLGSCLVAAGPRSLRTKHYATIQKVMARYFGKRHQSVVEVQPTRAVTRRVAESKMGKGKGSIVDFCSRIPAGQVMVQLPQIRLFQEFDVAHVQKCLSHLANIMPNRCIIRNQFNQFNHHEVLAAEQQAKNKVDRRKIRRVVNQRLRSPYRT